MLKSKILLLSSILMLGIVCGCISENFENPVSKFTINNGKLVVAVFPGITPSIYEENNELKGFDVELTQEIAKRLDLKPEFKPCQYYGDGFIYLKNEEVDCIVSLTLSPDRKNWILYSRPYFSDQTGVFVLNNSPIEHISELNGKKIGIIKDSIGTEWVDTFATEISANLVYYDSAYDLAMDIGSGRVDAVISPSINAYYVSEVTGVKIKPISERRINTYWVIAVKDENNILSDKINEILLEMETDGTMTSLKNKWLE